MKRNACVYLIAGLLSIVSASCASSPTSPGPGNLAYVALVNLPLLTVVPGNGTNLLVNSGFTKNGSPSLDGWSSNDSSAIAGTSDRPVSSDTYSMGIIRSGTYGETYVTGTYGRVIITLTYWSKVPAQGYDSGLSVTLVQTRADSGQLSSVVQFDTSSYWKEFTLSDTADVLPTDRIWVTFMGVTFLPVPAQ